MDTVLNHSDAVAFHELDVDTQHRRIMQLIDDLSAALESRRPASYVLDALDRLTDYLQLHCADEEQFLEEQDYPADLLRTHRAEHRDCIDHIHEIRCRIRSSGPDQNPEAAEEIRALIDSHTATADQAYMDYFRDHEEI